MSLSRKASQPGARSERTAAPEPGREPFGPARALVRGYALSWGDRVLKGLGLRASADDDPVEALFLDPFAGVDHPLPPGAVPVPVEVLGRLFPPAGTGPSRVRALLLEEDPVKVEWLLEACRGAGLGERARLAGEGAGPAEVALVEGTLDGGIPWGPAEESARAGLALLDPPGAGRLPLGRLLALLERHPALDLLLRFPVSDLRRLAGFRGIPLADLPPYARRAAEGISRLLGDARHEWAIPWTRSAGEGETVAEAAVVERLAAGLREGSGRLVRVFPVESSAGVDFLLLASADPARILLMNEVLADARGAGRLPWPEEEGPLVRFVPRAELELFGGSGAVRAAGAEARDRVVDATALAHSLATRFAGRRVPLRRVLESVLDSALFESDVRRALQELRRDGRALFRSLAQPEAEIAFPRQGGARAPGRSRSRRRGSGPEELSLALDPETD